MYGVQEGKARLKDWRLSSCAYLGVHCFCWASGCHVFVSLLSVSTLSVFQTFSNAVWFELDVLSLFGNVEILNKY